MRATWGASLLWGDEHRWSFTRDQWHLTPNPPYLWLDYYNYKTLPGTTVRDDKLSASARTVVEDTIIQRAEVLPRTLEAAVLLDDEDVLDRIKLTFHLEEVLNATFKTDEIIKVRFVELGAITNIGKSKRGPFQANIRLMEVRNG